MSRLWSYLHEGLVQLVIASLLFASVGTPVRAAPVAPSQRNEPTPETESALALSISSAIEMVRDVGPVEAEGWFPVLDASIDDKVTARTPQAATAQQGWEPVDVAFDSATPSKCQAEARTGTPDLLSPAYIPATTRLQSTAVPTYYFSSRSQEIVIDKPFGVFAAAGCFYDWAETKVVAVVFRTTVTGDCPQFKRMDGANAECSAGEDLWTNQSYPDLPGTGYYCNAPYAFGAGQEICQLVAPEATYKNTSKNLSSGGQLVRGG